LAVDIVSQIGSAIQGRNAQAFLSDGTKDVLFNVTISTKESDTNKITTHAIEKGADVTDNVIESPKGFSFTAVLSDDDIKLLNPGSFFEDSIEDRLQTINDWLSDKTLLTYYGHETDFESVVIESITRNKSGSFGSGLGLDISIKQLNIVESAVVDIDVTTITKKGNTPTKTATSGGTRSTQAIKKKSWLKSAFG